MVLKILAIIGFLIILLVFGFVIEAQVNYEPNEDQKNLFYTDEEDEE